MRAGGLAVLVVDWRCWGGCSVWLTVDEVEEDVAGVVVHGHCCGGRYVELSERW